MSEVFNDKQSVFFVGGRGDKSGRIADAGGCTKVWWDTEVAANGEAAAMAKLMTATGAPIITMDAKAYTVANDRITASSGAFEGAERGMVVYVIETPTPNANLQTGRYEITAVSGAFAWIECAGIDGAGNGNANIEIGGAFDTLENALDETSAASNSVQIHTNLSETLGATLGFDYGGVIANNTFKRVSGYNILPGDMNKGAAYYESPIEILKNGSIDLSKCVTLDANGGAYDVLTFGASIDNCVLENIHFTGTTDRGIGFADDNAVGILFRNCRLSDMLQGFNKIVIGMSFISCYSHSDVTSHPYVFRGPGGLLMYCVSNLAVDAVLTNIVSTHGTVIGCITVGGLYGVSPIGVGSSAVVIGNTFYNLTDYGVMAQDADRVVVFNNIFCLAPGAKGLYTENSSLIYNDYNCFIETDGTPLTIGETGSGDEVPVKGKHSIELDPKFIDAGNYDFGLNPISPCLNTGKGGNVNMGSWPRISRIRR